MSLVSLTLDRIPARSRIFLDSTIFIYYFAGASAQCRVLLERCEGGDLMGITSAAVLAEVAHRLMMSEAVASGLVGRPNVVQKLRAKPDVVRQLHAYQEDVDSIPLMGVDVVPVDTAALLQSADIRRQYGLLVNDSLVVAGAIANDVEHLASADGDFERVKELRLYRPDDLG